MRVTILGDDSVSVFLGLLQFSGFGLIIRTVLFVIFSHVVENVDYYIIHCFYKAVLDVIDRNILQV